jgi:hypothetical protein
MNKTVIGIAIIIYNFLIVAGTAWLIAVYDWSGWWFALTFALLISVRSKDE